MHDFGYREKMNIFANVGSFTNIVGRLPWPHEVSYEIVGDELIQGAWVGKCEISSQYALLTMGSRLEECASAKLSMESVTKPTQELERKWKGNENMLQLVKIHRTTELTTGGGDIHMCDVERCLDQQGSTSRLKLVTPKVVHTIGILTGTDAFTASTCSR